MSLSTKAIKVEFENAIIEIRSNGENEATLIIGNKGYPEYVSKFSLNLKKEELLSLCRMSQQMYNEGFE